MGKLDIKEISGKSATLDELKQFASAPFFIPWYRSQEPNKVFPLMINEISDLNASRRPIAKLLGYNPFFEHTEITYFIAKRDGLPIGRIAAYVDHRYNAEHAEHSGWVGCFDSIEDKKVADLLFAYAFDKLKNAGCDQVIGPAKYNANAEVGLLIEGFQHKPYFMEGYNAPYYQEFFESQGFQKENDWCSITVEDTCSQKLLDYMTKAERMHEIAMRGQSEIGKILRETKIRHANMADFDKEKEIIKTLYNSEWGKGNHTQFVSMTDNEFKALAAGIKLIAVEDLILIAERKGQPIGVAVTVPNLNEIIEAYDKKEPSYMPSPRFADARDLYRDIKIFGELNRKKAAKDFESLRVLILGVVEDYRKSGLDAMLYHDSWKASKELGVKRASFSQMVDVNIDILRPLEKMGDKALVWRVYSMGL